MDKRDSGLIQAVGALPPRLRQQVLERPIAERRHIEEVRLRLGQPLSLILPQTEVVLKGPPVTAQELDTLLELASRASVHTVMEQIRRGYLTVAGGHRIGLCGTAVMRDGEIYTLRRLSSASIRVARECTGVSAELLPNLMTEGTLGSVLILAPPGLGKTTLLRDLIRAVSSGEGTAPLRVGVADERGELAALWDGVPQLEMGSRTDVLEGCPKAQGLMMLLRAMNPQVLAMDEITAPEDVSALVQAAGCGATLLATAHGAGQEDLRRRPLYRTMIEARVFSHLVTIERVGGERRYAVERLL